MGVVYVVHCIDTEGPLYQAPEVLFEQVENIFGIQIERSPENLNKLREGTLFLEGKEKEVKNLLDINKNLTKGSWEEIEDVLDEIMTMDYRHILPDSKGQGWKYSWFCMDHVGFEGQNPRKRDSGHHKVFDRYYKRVKEQNCGDTVQFHHHPVPFSGNYNESGTAFWGQNTLNEILTRKIIDRCWFPRVFRPGFHTERPDSHWFLEQWIPFDYGNQSMSREDSKQPDLSDGRFGDWRYAPAEWKPYHPSHDNYQKKGNCRRWITRCLNMYARVREICQEDVAEAFEMAEKEGKSILAFTNHDYKNMKFEIERIRVMIKQEKEKYPNVEFEYCNAVEAMQKYLQMESESIDLELQLEQEKNNNKIVVTTKKKIFGPQPFLAIKTRDNKYYWDNFDFYKENQWHYSLDMHTVPMENVSCIGVAANHTTGTTEVVVWDNLQKKKWKEIYY